MLIFLQRVRWETFVQKFIYFMVTRTYKNFKKFPLLEEKLYWKWEPFKSFYFTRHYRSRSAVIYFSNSWIYWDSSPSLNCYLEIQRSIYVKSCSPCKEPFCLLSWIGNEIWINLFPNSGHYFSMSRDPRIPIALSLRQ